MSGFSRVGGFSRRAILKTLGMTALGVAAGPIASACGAPAPIAPGGATTPAAAPPGAATTTPAAASAPAAAASASELRLHVRTGSEADTLADRLPEFEASVPGVKVKIESFPAADYFAKLQTLVAGGQLGDVLWGIVHQGWGPYFLASGVTTSLDSLIESDKFDLNQYYPVSLQAARVFEGKMLGLPFKLQPFAIGVYYNATAFEEEQVPPPTLQTTQDELVQIARRMQKNDPSGRPTRFGFFPALIGTAYESLVTVVRPFGGDVTSPDGTQAVLNSPAAVAGMKWVYDMVFQDKVAPSVQQLGGDPAMPLDSMFVAGTGAMFQSGSSAKSLPTRVKDKFVVKNTLMPMGPANNRGSMAGVDVMMINKQSKFQKESWGLTKMLCDKETGIRLGEGRGGASGTCGARPDAFNDPRLLANPLHQVWIKAAEDSGPLYVPANFRGGEVDTLIKQKLGGLYNGDEKFEQKFFDDLNAGVQQILDKPKP
ncbi:MAG: extracellular solute-binding protein [Chloroflexota bacterium]|nr:extracellular solute-binding protein [Chloroflexota bacterium]